MSLFDTAQLVKNARIASGMTQNVFCKQLGKVQETISKYEKGTHTPPPDVIMRCIRILREKDTKSLGLEEETLELIIKLKEFEGAEMAAKRAALKVIMNALLVN